MFSFRRLQVGDFDLLHNWLNRDFVAKWYIQPDPTIEGIREKYLPFVTGTDHRTKHYISMIEEKPCGFIQWYKLSDWPQYESDIHAEQNAISIDLFIGEREFLHKGYGPSIIKSFLQEVAFPASGSQICYVGPEAENLAAIKCYQKAGFKFVETLDVPGDPGLTAVFKLYCHDLQ